MMKKMVIAVTFGFLCLFMAGNVLAQLVCAGTIFDDVDELSVGLPFCHFIERFSQLGITGGCRPDDPDTPGSQAMYCPSDPLTRAQMAIFLTTALDMVPGLISQGPCSEGQVLKKAGTGFTCADDGSGLASSTVAPLDGTSAVGTSSDYSRGDHKHGIGTGTITSLHILDGTIQFSDIGSNGCATNQVLKWNGSAWVCGADNDTSYTAGAGLNLTREANCGGTSQRRRVRATPQMGVFQQPAKGTTSVFVKLNRLCGTLLDAGPALDAVFRPDRNGLVPLELHKRRSGRFQRSSCTLYTFLCLQLDT